MNDRIPADVAALIKAAAKLHYPLDPLQAVQLAAHYARMGTTFSAQQYLKNDTYAGHHKRVTNALKTLAQDKKKLAYELGLDETECTKD